MSTTKNTNASCDDFSNEQYDSDVNTGCGCKDKTLQCNSTFLQKSSNADFLFVPKGTLFEIHSDVNLAEIHNLGTLKVAENVTIHATQIKNEGKIFSESESLNIHFDSLASSGELAAPNGKILLTKAGNTETFIRLSSSRVIARDTINISSQFSLYIRGGDFASKELYLTTEGALDLSVERIDAEVHIKAETIATGVKRGELNIVSACADGDPLFWNTGGDVTMQINAAPADFIAFASGNVTASGDIDARNQNPGGIGGRIYIAAGVQFSPPVGESPNDCIECSALYQLQIPPVPSGSSGSVNMQGINLLTNSNSITIYAYGGNISVGNVISAGLNGGIAGDIKMICDGAIQIGGRVDAKGSGSGDAGNIHLQTVHGNIGVIGDVLNQGPNIGKTVKMITSFSGYGISVGGSILAGGGVGLQTAFDDAEQNKIIVSGDVKIDGQSFVAKAGSTISVGGDISTNSSTGIAGAIDIQAYLGKSGAAASSKFLVGSFSDNGVGGTISAQSVSVPSGRPWVHLRNQGNGGIELVHGDRISVTAAADRSGDILLMAPEGPIKLTGLLSADGSGTVKAGSIYISGDSLDARGGPTVISASDSQANVGRRLAIGVREIKYDISGLQLLANGDGPNTQLLLVTKGGVDISISNLVYTPVLKTDINKELTLNGTGPLEIRANGSENNVSIYGRPLSILGGDTTIESSGANTIVGLDGRIANGAPNGLVLGSQKLTVIANGDNNSKGGHVAVRAFSPKVTSANGCNFTADGDGSGDGGFIDFQCIGSAGTTTLPLGNGAEMISASAKGGTTSGDGGTVQFLTSALGIKLNGDSAGQDVLNVSVQGSDGNGGSIVLFSDGPLNMIPPPAPTTLNIFANGKGQGNGGTVDIRQSQGINDINVGGNTNINISAKPGTIGSGGSVNIETSWSLNLRGANITVSPDTSDNGEGGVITALVNTNNSLAGLTASGVFNANAAKAHDGGHIKLQGPKVSVDDAHITANAGTQGNGGLIQIHQPNANTILEVKSTNNTLISSFGGTNGGTGGTIEVLCNGGISVHENATIDASAKSGSGGGGKIYLQSAFQPMSLILSDLEIRGKVNINNGGGVGGAGQIFLSTGHPNIVLLAAPKILLKETAKVSMECPSIPGVIRVENIANPSAASPLFCTMSAGSELVAQNGYVRFFSNGDAAVSGGPNGSPGITGVVTAQIENGTFFIQNPVTLQFTDVLCKKGDVVVTDTANLITHSGLFQADELILTALNGNIGSPSEKFKTKTALISAHSILEESGTIHISNVALADRVTLRHNVPGANMQSGGDFYFDSTGCIYLEGSFRVGGDFTCVSTNASIYPRGIMLDAFGDVFIGLGSVPTKIAGSPKPGFSVTAGGSGSVYWGNPVGVTRNKTLFPVTLNPSAHDIVFKADSPTEEILFDPRLVFQSSRITAR